MVAPAVAPPGLSGGLCLFDSDRSEFYGCLLEKGIQFAGCGWPASVFQDDGCFQEVDDSHSAANGPAYYLGVALCSFFSEQDGQDDR